MPGDFRISLETYRRGNPKRLMPVWDAVGQDNMPSLVKYAQSLQGVKAGVARRPTSPPSEAQQSAVRETLADLDLI